MALAFCKYPLLYRKSVRYNPVNMAKRYSQYCPIAHALELVGDRWALLVVRELIDGPKRYTDLLEGLPGCGTNILAARLRALETANVVQKRKLPPPAASTVYELTDYGRELEEAMFALARWGARSLGPPAEDEKLVPGWSVNAMRATFDPAAARGVRATYELRVGGEVTRVRVERGKVEPAAGPAERPDAVIETDPSTLFELVSRRLVPAEAVAAGRARVEGDPEALDRFVSMFHFEPRSAAA
jgi:DNA-binding HxlR family transcriptional regulator